MITMIIHIANQEPVKVDVESMPNPGDQVLICKNPRERNDKPFSWVDDGVTTVIFPWWRINYVQVMPTGEDIIEFPLWYRE